MKNLTLRVEERILDTARRIAAERSTSVNALVRAYLKDLARNEDRRRQARRELLKLCRGSKAKVGTKTWTRDQLHDR